MSSEIDFSALTSIDLIKGYDKQETAEFKELHRNIDLMREWVEAVKAGNSIQDLIPVNAPPTIGNADDLERRLKFIEEHVVPQFS